MATLKNLFTVSDLAERHNKSAARIRQIAIEHDIGTCIENRLRLFTDDEADDIARIIDTTGRNYKKKKVSP